MAKQEFSTLEVMGIVDLEKTDFEIGQWLVATWIGFQAEKFGIPLDEIPHNWAEELVAATARIDSDSVVNAPLESAFRKACSGDFEAAGRMLRAHMWKEARDSVNEKYATAGVNAIQEKRRGGQKSGAAKRLTAAQWHDRCRQTAAELLRNGKQPREIAGILAKRFGVSATQVRAVLRNPKVK